MENKITLEEYFDSLTHPLAYYRINKEVLNENKEYFTKMYNISISSVWAIWIMDSELIKEIEIYER